MQNKQKIKKEIEKREFSPTSVICLFLLCSVQMNAMITIYLLVKQPNGVKSRCYLLLRRSIVCIWGKQISKWNCHSIFACHNSFKRQGVLVCQAEMKISRSLAFDIQQLELNIWMDRQWIGCHIKGHNETTPF